MVHFEVGVCLFVLLLLLLIVHLDVVAALAWLQRATTGLPHPPFHLRDSVTTARRTSLDALARRSICALRTGQDRNRPLPTAYKRKQKQGKAGHKETMRSRYFQGAWYPVMYKGKAAKKENSTTGARSASRARVVCGWLV